MQLNHAITRIVCGHEMLHWLLAILVSHMLFSLSWCCFFLCWLFTWLYDRLSDLKSHYSLRSWVELQQQTSHLMGERAANWRNEVCAIHILSYRHGMGRRQSIQWVIFARSSRELVRQELIESRENFYTIFNFSKELHNLLINFHNEILFGAILKH